MPIPHSLTLALAALVVAAVVAALLKRPSKGRTQLTAKSPLHARPIMSLNEQEAYRRLRAALPDLFVFPQISLGGFIDPTHPRHRFLRNHYDRLTADFVICDAATRPLAIVEIDDRSHAHPRAQSRDARKNSACEAARLPILRWPATPLPTIEMFRERITPLLKPART